MYYVTDPRYGSKAYSDAVMNLLGLSRGAHLPREGMPARVIEGVEAPSGWHEGPRRPVLLTVWVMPGHPPRDWRSKSSKHRVMCACPGCNKTVPIGRLAQHKCKFANEYDLYWAPTSQTIATVRAKDEHAAIRKAPKPYRKYLGEIGTRNARVVPVY